MHNDIFSQLDQTLVIYLKSHGVTNDDFYCKDCGNLIIDIDDAKNARVCFSNDGKNLYFLRKDTKKRTVYRENKTNQWSITGKKIAEIIHFKKLCWPCFFKQLHAKADIKRLARKGKWYGRLYRTGIDEIPATFTTASDYFIYLFDVDEDLLIKQKQKIRTASKEHYIEKYGEEEGLRRYEKMCARQGYTASTKYFVEEKGMTEEQAKEYHASRATTLENYIKRYGKEDGLLRWNKYCAREAYAGNSLMYYIEKYGEVDGKQKFEEMLAKKTFTMKTYSDVSQELFKMIDEYLGDYSVSSRWELKNHEFELFIQMPGYEYLTKVDYCLNNKIIEFNGTYWHADPRRYKSGDVQRRHKGDIIVDNIWERDKNKQNGLKQCGYDVHVVWEDDYYNDPTTTVANCCKFLRGQSL